MPSLIAMRGVILRGAVFTSYHRIPAEPSTDLMMILYSHPWNSKKNMPSKTVTWKMISMRLNDSKTNQGQFGAVSNFSQIHRSHCAMTISLCKKISWQIEGICIRLRIRTLIGLKFSNKIKWTYTLSITIQCWTIASFNQLLKVLVGTQITEILHRYPNPSIPKNNLH